jgi:hypothetical protein
MHPRHFIEILVLLYVGTQRMMTSVDDGISVRPYKREDRDMASRIYHEYYETMRYTILPPQLDPR